MKDPLYQKILDRLNWEIDPQAFEDCMADLLRDVYPALVPVRGGSDSGFDGAVSDGVSEPYPLICTTEADVIGNLTRSLDSVLTSGWPTRKVALATSRHLTPQRRLNLFERAREKGFQMTQVFDQRGLADRLYRDHRWLRKLLDLSGAPSALSPVPMTRRPLLDLEPIGREAELKWMGGVSADSVLFGEPGSGKTFLVVHLIRQGWDALFLDLLASPEAIAGALLEQAPKIVVVDDAHRNPDILTWLAHRRRETDADFSILALTWKGGQDAVIEALGGVPKSRICQLELLTRDQILQVIRQAGVEENDERLRELVDQSANKPGLAVTISTLWLQGLWQEILDGTALRRNTLGLFRDLAGKQAEDILAAFSLGGDRGMRMEDVGHFLRLSLPDLRQITASLEAGGVLSEPGSGALAVWPRQLRYSLLRTVFFPGNGTGHSYRQLLAQTVSFRSAVETLVTARLRGANVPSSELRELVGQTEASCEAWQGLAAVGPEEAIWALDHYAGDSLDLFPSALSRAAPEVLPRVFEEAERRREMEASRRVRPMEILSSWIQGGHNPTEALHRRRLLAGESQRYLASGGLQELGIRGLSLALTPIQRGRSLDPGIGNTVKIWSGLLPSRVLLEVGAIWEGAKEALRDLEPDSWKHLVSTLWDWLHPEYCARTTEVPQDIRDAMRVVSVKMLQDLVNFVGDSPAFSAELHRLAAQAKIELRLPARDSVFELLYPMDTPRTGTDEAEAHQQALEALSRSWSQETPAQIAQKLALYEREARKIRRPWTRDVPSLCRSLAVSTGTPEEWLDRFLKQNLAVSSLRPFFEKIIETRRQGWEARLQKALRTEPLSSVAVELILQLQEPPADLLAAALEKSAEMAWLVETICLRREAPIPTLRALLRLAPTETALAAAVGEWCSEPQGQVRAEVLEDWQEAMLLSRPDLDDSTGPSYWVGAILSQNPDLAYRWICARLGELDQSGFYLSMLGDSPVAHAAGALRREHRIQILGELETLPPQAMLPPGLVSLLIGKDLEIFANLLGRKSLAAHHLEILSRKPEEDWERFATTALRAGYGPQEVAEAAFRGTHTCTGSGVSYWQSWEQPFATLELHPDPALREVGAHGRQEVRRNLEEAQQEERRWELRGLGVA